MAAIILAGVIVMFLVNPTGKPSVKYGIPLPVMARASIGARGAYLPARVRVKAGWAAGGERVSICVAAG